MGVLLWPQTRQEQIRDQRYRRAQSEPVGAGVSGQSKPQTLPVTDEEINRIWYADDPRYQRSQKIREMQEPKSLEALLLDGYWYDDDPDYQALVQAGKLKTVQDLVEELKAREQTEKARDVSTQSAREEQLAARKYQEQREREQNAYDLSTQAALDEKKAMRKALDSNNAVTYNKYTGEYTIATDKLADTGKWNVTTADGKVIVDPQVEQKIAQTSRIMAAILTQGPQSLNPLDDVLSPVIENLISAGLLRYEYGTGEYVLNNPNTKEVGIYFTEVMGKGGLINVGLIADKYGNVGITFTPGASVGTPNLSAGAYISGTNASKIYDTKGVGLSVGGSVGAKGVSAGFEYNVLVDAEAGKIYTGQTASFGASLGSVVVPVEGHASVTWTEVFGFNVLQTLEKLRGEKR